MHSTCVYTNSLGAMPLMQHTCRAYQRHIEETSSVESSRNGASEVVVSYIEHPSLREDLAGIWQGATAH